MSEENTSAPARKVGRAQPKPASGVSAETEVIRGDMRERAARDDDPRARAAKRAAEIRGHRSGENLDEADRFKINQDEIPPGWSYEWKRKTVYGKEDPAYEVELARGGWEPVPASRHPSMMPKGHYETIERDGMILMERPKELTEDAHAADLRKARLQVRSKEAQLNSGPDGTFERDRPLVKKSYESMPIPKE
jgi:hypothetical protein